MNFDEMFPSKWLDPPDLNGRDVTVIIEGTQMEKVGMETQPVMYFEGKRKGLIINKTRAAQLKAALGTSDSEQMKGQRITLYVGISKTSNKEFINIRERSAVADHQTRATAAPAQRFEAPPPPVHTNAGLGQGVSNDVTDDDIPF